MPDPAALAFLLAESGIRQLYARYCDALWRRDTAAFVDCFAEEAVWKIAGGTVVGRAAIGAQFEAAMAASHRVMMFTGLPVIYVEGDTVSGRIHVTEIIKRLTGEAFRTLGSYYDRFVEHPDRWRFASHHFDLHHFGPPDFSAPYLDIPDYGAPPAMPGPDAPSITRKA